jgi:hypothetical protein
MLVNTPKIEERVENESREREREREREIAVKGVESEKWSERDDSFISSTL